MLAISDLRFPLAMGPSARPWVCFLLRSCHSPWKISWRMKRTSGGCPSKKKRKLSMWIEGKERKEGASFVRRFPASQVVTTSFPTTTRSKNVSFPPNPTSSRSLVHHRRSLVFDRVTSGSDLSCFRARIELTRSSVSLPSPSPSSSQPSPVKTSLCTSKLCST